MRRKPKELKSKIKTKNVSDEDKEVPEDLLIRLRDFVTTHGSEYLKDHNIPFIIRPGGGKYNSYNRALFERHDKNLVLSKTLVEIPNA